MGSWGQALDSIVTPDTVEAIGNDPRLRRTLMSMVDFTVDFSDQLVARYESPQLQETREALQEYKEKIKRSLGSLEETDSEGDGGSKIKRRQFPTFGGLFGAAAPSAAPSGGTGNGGGGGLPNPLGLPLPGAPATPSNTPGGGGNPLGLPGLPGLPTPGSGGGGGGGDAGNPLGGLLPGAGGGNMSPGILSGLLQPLTDGLKNVGNQLVANLNGPGMFLGIGIGAGAAQGLNLSTQAKTMEVASK
ncbi:hypothetical protein CH063_11009, partial [Colletotrichum higginsianum]